MVTRSVWCVVACTEAIARQLAAVQKKMKKKFKRERKRDLLSLPNCCQLLLFLLLVYGKQALPVHTCSTTPPPTKRRAILAACVPQNTYIKNYSRQKCRVK